MIKNSIIHKAKCGCILNPKQTCGTYAGGTYAMVCKKHKSPIIETYRLCGCGKKIIRDKSMSKKGYLPLDCPKCKSKNQALRIEASRIKSSKKKKDEYKVLSGMATEYNLTDAGKENRMMLGTLSSYTVKTLQIEIDMRIMEIPRIEKKKKVVECIYFEEPVRVRTIKEAIAKNVPHIPSQNLIDFHNELIKSF